MRVLVLVLSLIFLSCKSSYKASNSEYVLIDSVGIRAIYPTKDRVWFGGTNSKIGFVKFDDNRVLKKVQLNKDKVDFRSMTFTNSSLLFLNAGSPATLYEVIPDKLTSKIIYTESGEQVFYDSMFIDSITGFGIIIGDPTDKCLSVLKTEDFGKTWNKISCDNLPTTVNGEAAFAASNTNVKLIDGVVYIISGGIKSRLFKSSDKGNTWQVYDTPIIQGGAMTGAFTMDFYNKNIGFIAGGNYENPTDNSKNKAITFDGGKTWKLVAENETFGYASCVQFMPKSKGKVIVSCGTTGVYMSSNFGNTWEKISSDKEFYTLRFLNKTTLFLAGKNKMAKIKISH